MLPRLTVGEYREQGFVELPFRDPTRGVTRSRIPPVHRIGGHSGLDRFRPLEGVIPYVLYGG